MNVKEFYRRVMPLWVRQNRFVEMAKRLYYRMLSHDRIYDRDYYLTVVEEPAARSAAAMVRSIERDFAPAAVIDVGCGTGAFLEAMRSAGATVFGLEYSLAALELCRERGLDVRRFDLEHDAFDDLPRFDVAVSVEVAEHLPESAADRYVDLLTNAADVVVFTAAPPGQGGTDHVNEQPRSYWIEKFRQRSFVYDEAISSRWRDEWIDARVTGWYTGNLMIFRREQPAA